LLSTALEDGDVTGCLGCFPSSRRSCCRNIRFWNAQLVHNWELTSRTTEHFGKGPLSGKINRDDSSPGHSRVVSKFVKYNCNCSKLKGNESGPRSRPVDICFVRNLNVIVPSSVNCICLSNRLSGASAAENSAKIMCCFLDGTNVQLIGSWTHVLAASSSLKLAIIWSSEGTVEKKMTHLYI
jgi:hypothetical protein